MPARMQNNWSSHSLLVGMQNGTVILKNSLTILTCTHHITRKVHSRETKTYVQIHTHTHTKKKFVHKCWEWLYWHPPKLKTTQMFFNEWMDKQYVCGDSKNYLLYDLIYITFLTRQNYKGRKHIGGRWGHETGVEKFRG